MALAIKIRLYSIIFFSPQCKSNKCFVEKRRAEPFNCLILLQKSMYDVLFACISHTKLHTWNSRRGQDFDTNSFGALSKHAAAVNASIFQIWNVPIIQVCPQSKRNKNGFKGHGLETRDKIYPFLPMKLILFLRKSFFFHFRSIDPYQADIPSSVKNELDSHPFRLIRSASKLDKYNLFSPNATAIFDFFFIKSTVIYELYVFERIEKCFRWDLEKKKNNWIWAPTFDVVMFKTNRIHNLRSFQNNDRHHNTWFYVVSLKFTVSFQSTDTQNSVSWLARPYSIFLLFHLCSSYISIWARKLATKKKWMQKLDKKKSEVFNKWRPHTDAYTITEKNVSWRNRGKNKIPFGQVILMKFCNHFYVCWHVSSTFLHLCPWAVSIVLVLQTDKNTTTTKCTTE